MVDLLGSVRGVAGLRVVDASILPAVPSSATILTTIMLAEHIAKRAYPTFPPVADDVVLGDVLQRTAPDA